MKKNCHTKRLVAGFLAFALACSGTAAPADAAAKPRLNKTKASIRVGGKVKLKVIHKKKKVTWSSSKKKVATVSKSGLVRGKKAGVAKITAKTGGKKLTCRVTVKAAKTPSPDTPAPANTVPAGVQPSLSPTAAPGASAKPSATPDAAGNQTPPPQNSSGPSGSQTPAPGASSEPTVNPTGTPGTSSSPVGSTSQPDPTVSVRPGESQAPPPQSSSTPSGNQTLPPQSSSTPSGNQTPAPEASSEPTANPTETPGASLPGGNTLVPTEQMPPAGGADTLTVGSMSVKLGMSKAGVEASIGAKPNRTEVSPLGYDVYIYNPSGKYTNYLMVQFDNDKVAAMSTISSYFTYEDMLAAGQQGASDLTGAGFTKMGTKYNYNAGYMHTGDNEYVLAFVDQQGSKKIYGVQILAKQTSKSTGVTDLDDLFKAEKGIYNDAVNAAMAKELFDWACAFRAVKGLNLYTASDADGAQKHSDYMAATGVVDESSADGKSLGGRMEEEYGYWIYCAECNASRSIDAFGFVTWMIDNTESGCYSKLTKEKNTAGETLDLYLATGFSYLSSAPHKTFATLDIFAF